MLPPSLLPFRPCGKSGLAGAKNLEPELLGLEALQPLEIPQNRQRIVWKSLERNSSDLERLGKKLGASAGSDAPSRELRRGHAPRRAAHRCRAFARRPASSAVSEFTTSAYSPCRFASDSACTSSAAQSLPPRSRTSTAQQASPTRNTRYPMSAAARTVASTEFCVSTPQTTRVVAPMASRAASRSVSTKALWVRLAVTGSPGSGAVSGLKTWPGLSGR